MASENRLRRMRPGTLRLGSAYLLALLVLAGALDCQSQQAQSAGSPSTLTQTNRAEAEASVRTGLMRGQVGDFSGAATAFRHALEIAPDLAEAHYNLGLALIGESGNIPAWKEALGQFKAALAARPAYPQALRMAGVCLLESGQADDAIPELQAALRLEPGSAETHFDLGRALDAAGKSSEAYSEYLAALKARHPYPEADAALGRLLLARGDKQAAAERFNAALAANPDLESAHYGLATALKAEGKKAESRIELQQASMLLQRQSDTVMSSHLSNEGLNRARSGDIPAAIQFARKAVWLNPADAVADFNLGLLLADAGDLQASAFQLRKALSLARHRSVFYLNLSKVQEKESDRSGAIETIRRAIETDPANPDLQARLNQLEIENSSAPKPRSSEAADPFPFGAPSDTAAGHFVFATELSKEGDFVGAIGELLRALALEPTRADIRYSLAVAQTQIGQDDRAELELRTVLRLSPDSIPAHMALGSLLFQEKDFEGAASEFRQVLVLQPGNQEATQMLQQCRPSNARQEQAPSIH